MRNRTKELSKFLSYVLRHRPDRIGIVLDQAGWISVGDLLEACRRHGKAITAEELQHVVETNDKRRFAFNDTGERIRANQGHSVAVDLDLAPSVPPERLYHGTVRKFLPSIRKEGLKPKARHHVHLSADRETATRVGSRRGPPVVLVIESARMHRDGHVFHMSENGVWLTDVVPPCYLRYPTQS